MVSTNEAKFVMSVAEAAALLGTHPQKIRESIDNGTFEFGTKYITKAGKPIYRVSRPRLYRFLGIDGQEE